MLIKKGIDKEAYISFVTENKEMLYRVAFGYLHDSTEALDAVDEAIYLGYAHINDLKEPEYLKTWVTRILINKCYKILRKGKREFNNTDFPKCSANFEEDNVHLKFAVNNLSEDLRKIIVMRYFGGYTISETAEILKIPVGTVSTRTKKALEILRVEVSD
jgi:RNA polymerase sigma-70 factor (ECF subfamily)